MADIREGNRENRVIAENFWQLNKDVNKLFKTN